MMVALVLAPLVLGVLLYKLPAPAARTLAVAGQVGLGAWTVVLLSHAAAAGTTFQVLGGGDRTVYIALRGGQSALTLVLLTIVLSTAALVYVLGEAYADGKMLLLILALQGLTSGILLIDDVFTLFVLFEVATLAVIVLVMFRTDRRSIYDGLYYLTIQIVAMLFFLFGIAYLYRAFGVLNVTAIGDAIAAGVDPHALVLPFAFLLTGLGLKAGLFPLFSFVPRAYGNPGSPTVALMIMSGILVNAPLFWIARFVTLFSPALDLRGFLVVVGLITGVTGAVMALATADLRLVLAYSTVAQAGLITIGLAAGTTAAADGALLHLLNHALLKSLLFLCAGMIVREYGTGNLAAIRGAARRLPRVTAASLVAILGMVGAPLTGGAASKGLILDGTDGWTSVAVWVVNAGTMLVFLRYSAMFFGRTARPASPSRPRVDATQRVVVISLAVLALASGAAAPALASLLLGPGAVVPTVAGTAKVGGFLLLAVGAALVRRATLPFARRVRGPLLVPLSLPQSVAALCVFFGATALAGAWAAAS
jgi:multicomponent Na+:H+ antiporter subunit D